MDIHAREVRAPCVVRGPFRVGGSEGEAARGQLAGLSVLDHCPAAMVVPERRPELLEPEVFRDAPEPIVGLAEWRR